MRYQEVDEILHRWAGETPPIHDRLGYLQLPWAHSNSVWDPYIRIARGSKPDKFNHQVEERRKIWCPTRPGFKLRFLFYPLHVWQEWRFKRDLAKARLLYKAHTGRSWVEA